MRKLIDFNAGDLLTRGMAPSLAENQQELWLTGRNMEFSEGRVSKAKGWDVQETTGKVLALSQAYVEGIRRAYWAEQDKLFKWEYGVPTELGHSFGGLGYWQLETWGNWLVATNDFDAPKVWKNAGDVVDLAGVRRPRFRLMKKHANRMLGYFGQSVDWSSDSNIELWEPDLDNSAGGQYIRDLDSDIVAACPLGQHYAVYSFDRIVVQQYIGDPLFYSFTTAIQGAGAISDSAAVSVANMNFVLSQKGFYSTDGINLDFIDTPQIRTHVIGDRVNPTTTSIDLLEGRRTVGYHDEANGIVSWWYTCKDGVRRGVSFCYRNRAWSILDTEVWAAATQQVYEAGLLGGVTSWGFNIGSNAGPNPMAAEIETFPLDATQRERFKHWDLYRAESKRGDISGIEVRFGFADNPMDSPEWTAWEPLEYENWIDRDSVHLKVGLRSLGADASWSLTGFSIHGELGGYL